ncbi:MAG: glycosyltransferase [Verrucomicrobiota bacterium]|jgi:glycosyltransferase involved in cell wall biosynthesis
MNPALRIVITARNEAAAIEAFLSSLLRSVAFAEAKWPVQYEIWAVLDECHDNTERMVRRWPRVTIHHSRGGKVEAQRRGVSAGPFTIFSDADILLGENVVCCVTEAMWNDPALQVAYPAKRPLLPQRRTLMAEALYCYNRANGFQERRRYFNGKFFAIRQWHIPTRSELEPRLRQLPLDRFYDFHAGMRVDDIYLSRDVLQRHGADAIREIAEAEILYRPPETFRGMYRTYHRMRLEIERLNRLFPETAPAHQQRRYDWAAVRLAPARDRWLWRYFRMALALCQVRYACEKFYYQHLASEACPPWKPILETKQLTCSE